MYVITVALFEDKFGLQCLRSQRILVRGKKGREKTLDLFEWTSYKHVCCLLQIVTETSIRVAIEMLLLSKHRYSSNYTELLACWYGTLFSFNFFFSALVLGLKVVGSGAMNFIVMSI